MNKTDVLLQMMEQPHRYTAEEWQEILSDDECRELYTLMSMTQSAVDAARADKKVTDEMIDGEWQRLSSVQSDFQFRKFAAMFVGILMLSGIAFAAIHIISHSDSHKEKDNVAVSNVSPLTQQAPLPQDTTAAPQPKLYDNVPLGEIFEELSSYYQIIAVYRNDATRQIRLFYQWKPDYTIEKVVDMLNNFEWLQLELKNDTLYVSSTVEPQP
jgi:hypothetical protein